MKRLFVLVLLAGLVLSAGGCLDVLKGDNGKQGPQGEKGDPGKAMKDADVELVLFEKTTYPDLNWPYLRAVIKNNGTKNAHVIEVTATLKKNDTIVEEMVFLYHWIKPGEVKDELLFLDNIESHDEYDTIDYKIVWAYETDVDE